MTNDKQRKLWPFALALLALLAIIGAIVLHQNTRPSLDTSPIATPISPISPVVTATSPPVATFTATPRPTPTPTSTQPPAATLVPAPTDTPAPTVTPVPPTATATATAPTIGPVCQIQVNTIYYIKHGDTMWHIADCAYGDPLRWVDICEVNPQVTACHWIHAGNPLWIPR